MKSSTDLFDLVKSLSKSEKRYFKLFSSLQQGEKKYMRLFDAIDAQEECDDNALKAKFEGERFVAQFTVAKKYLYDLLVKALLIYHAESTVGGRIKELIRTVEVLFERGLLDQARKMSAKAIGLAERHEEFSLLVEALEWQRKIEGKDDLDTVEKINRFYQRLFGAVDRLREVVDHERIILQMGVLSSRTVVRTAEEEAMMAQLLNQLSFDHAEQGGSITSRLIACWAHAFYHYSHNEHVRALAWTTRQVELMEANPHFLFEHPRIYVKALSNQIMVSRSAARSDEFLASIEKLERMTPLLLESGRIRNPGLRAELFSTIYAQQMGAMIEAGEFERIISLNRELETGLREYEEFMTEDITARLLHLLCYAYFGMNDFRNALEYNNRVIAFDDPDLDGGLGIYARILRLLIYYELGESDYLDHLIRHTRAYLQRRQCVTHYAREILDMLDRLLRLRSPHGARCEFINTEHRLRLLEQDSVEKTAMRFFDFRQWLQGKIEHRPFADVIRSRTGTAYAAARIKGNCANRNDWERGLIVSPVPLPTQQSNGVSA